MVLARVANFFTNGDQPQNIDLRRDAAGAVDNMAESLADTAKRAVDVDVDIDDEAARPPYIHVRTSAHDSSDRR
jgi:hypothetical protein